MRRSTSRVNSWCLGAAEIREVSGTCFTCFPLMADAGSEAASQPFEVGCLGGADPEVFPQLVLSLSTGQLLMPDVPLLLIEPVSTCRFEFVFAESQVAMASAHMFG